MLLYEVLVVRLGAVSSVYGWNLGISQVGSVWSYESIVVSHIVFKRLVNRCMER